MRGFKKVLQVESEVITWKKVVQEIKTAFSIVHNIIIQTFDPEWEEFVDVDITLDEVPEKAKFRVEINQTVAIPTCSSLLDPFLSSTTSTSESDVSLGEVIRLEEPAACGPTSSHDANMEKSCTSGHDSLSVPAQDKDSITM